MNNKDKIEHIMALHNGELGVTWEDPDVVTPDTIANIDQLIQDERKEAVEKYRQQLNAYWPEGSEEPTLSSDQVLSILSRFFKDGADHINKVCDEINEKYPELTKGGTE